jgi:hypothetical protein
MELEVELSSRACGEHIQSPGFKILHHTHTHTRAHTHAHTFKAIAYVISTTIYTGIDLKQKLKQFSLVVKQQSFGWIKK